MCFSGQRMLKTIFYLLFSELIKTSNIVLIDAGFTSNKLNIFQFDKKILKKSYTEFFYPGLQDISENQVADLMTSILERAKKYIQENNGKINESKIAFIGTEGLRKLNKDKLDKIMSIVSQKLYESGFIVNDIEIMNGIDEGKYAWESIFYLKNLEKRDQLISRAYKNTSNEQDKLPGGYDGSKSEIKNLGSPQLNESKNDTELNDEENEDGNVSITQIHMKDNAIDMNGGMLEMGGGSLQMALSIKEDDLLTIYIKSFSGMGLKKGSRKIDDSMKHCNDFTMRCVFLYRSLFDLHDFVKKVPLRKAENLYLISFFYDKLSKYNKNISNVNDIVSIYDEYCKEEKNSDKEITQECKDLRYIILTLKGLGVSNTQSLQALRFLGNRNVTWGVSKALEMNGNV